MSAAQRSLRGGVQWSEAEGNKCVTYKWLPADSRGKQGSQVLALGCFGAHCRGSSTTLTAAISHSVSAAAAAAMACVAAARSLREQMDRLARARRPRNGLYRSQSAVKLTPVPSGGLRLGRFGDEEVGIRAPS